MRTHSHSLVIPFTFSFGGFNDQPNRLFPSQRRLPIAMPGLQEANRVAQRDFIATHGLCLPVAEATVEHLW